MLFYSSYASKLLSCNVWQFWLAKLYLFLYFPFARITCFIYASLQGKEEKITNILITSICLMMSAPVFQVPIFLELARYFEAQCSGEFQTHSSVLTRLVGIWKVFKIISNPENQLKKHWNTRHLCPVFR